MCTRPFTPGSQSACSKSERAANASSLPTGTGTSALASITPGTAESFGMPWLTSTVPPGGRGRCPPLHRLSVTHRHLTVARRRRPSGSVGSKRMNVGIAVIAALLLLALVAACSAVVQESRRDRNRLEERAADLSAPATRLGAVADAVTEAILILAGDGQVTLANRAAHRLFGAADGTLTDCHVEQLLPAFRPGAS